MGQIPSSLDQLKCEWLSFNSQLRCAHLYSAGRTALLWMEKHDRISILSLKVGNLKPCRTKRGDGFSSVASTTDLKGHCSQPNLSASSPPSCKSARSITPNRRLVNVPIAILIAMGSTEPCQLEIHDDMHLRIVGIGTVGLATLPQPPFSGIKRADDGLVSLVSGCTDRGLSHNF